MAKINCTLFLFFLFLILIILLFIYLFIQMKEIAMQFECASPALLQINLQTRSN